MYVTKRNGKRVEYDPAKINEFLEYVCSGINNVSMSDIAMNSNLFLFDGMTTKEINAAMLKSAEDLISEDSPNYDLVAGRILISNIRKDVYGDFEPDSLYEIIERNIRMGKYDEEILNVYSKEDIELFDSYIDHDRDYNYSIAGVREWYDKYLVQNKSTKDFYETPQISYMLMAMCYFMYDSGNENYSKEYLIKTMYDMLSLGIWNSPTPQVAGLRTPTRTYSSCTLIETADSINGIAATEFSAKRYATLRAGLGIGASSLRARRQPIRNGDAINTGSLYHAKSIEESALSCSQGGLRKGSLTFNWLGWHLDYEEIINYKNGSKPDAESMKHSDHSILINGPMLKRMVTNQDIYLFSPETVKGLYNSFFSSDKEKFEKLYQEASNNEDIIKSKISGLDYAAQLVRERIGTGRIYIGFADNMNAYSPFIEEVAPVRMSNLCQEIMQHTEPVEFKEKDDGSYSMDGLIALCNLGGINWGAIKNKEEMLEYGYVGVRALDNILSMQYYPFTAAKRHNDLYRPIGIGITGLAYWLAKNGLKYNNCYKLLDEWADFWSYSLIKASIELAKERGACDGISNTKWGSGLFPVDYYPKKVDTITPKVKRQHWEDLRPLLKEYGIRNATIMALMPGETSSKVSGRGTTNGVEPVRSYIVQKGGKSSKAKFVLPELERLKDKYDLVWEWQGCSQLIKTYAILQKYVDQGISCNTYYNKLNFDGDRVPFNVVFQDILDAYSYGLKTLYYNNNQDDNELEENKSKTTKVINSDIKTEEDDYCESCTL